MMKSTYSTIALSIIVAASSCKDVKPNDSLIEQMKDSMSVLVSPPCYKGIHIKEHQDVTITIGSRALYNSSEEKQKEVVTALTNMAVYFFEDNNYLDDGKVIFVPNETTIPTESDPKKEYEIDFSPLLKK